MFRTAHDLYRTQTNLANTTPAACADATDNITFMLWPEGIHGGIPGATWLKPGAEVSFFNADSQTHRITVSPAGLLSKQSFDVPPGTKVTTRVTITPTQATGGSLIDSVPPGRSVHDIIICP